MNKEKRRMKTCLGEFEFILIPRRENEKMENKKTPEHRGEVCYKLTLEIQDMLDRLQSLYEFFDTDTFKDLEALERQQLIGQYDIMYNYFHVLMSRLEYYRNKYVEYINGPLPYKENEDEER